MQHGAPLSLLAEPPFSHRAGWCGVIKLTLSPTLDNVLLIHLLCSGKTPLEFLEVPDDYTLIPSKTQAYFPHVTRLYFRASCTNVVKQ